MALFAAAVGFALGWNALGLKVVAGVWTLMTLPLLSDVVLEQVQGVCQRPFPDTSGGSLGSLPDLSGRPSYAERLAAYEECQSGVNDFFVVLAFFGFVMFVAYWIGRAVTDAEPAT